MDQPVPVPEISPRLITLCSWLCLIVGAAMPVLIVVQWQTADIPSYWGDHMGGPPAAHLRPLGGVLAAIPSLCLARGLWLARDCLQRVGRGEFFSARTIASLRGFARWSFIAAVAGLAAYSVIGLALTLANPPCHRELTFGINTQEVMGVLLSGIFWIIAGVLARAAQVADENRQFV